MKQKEYSLEVGGKNLSAVFTDLADQAHGSVMLRYGETVVLATVCMSRDKQDGLGFFNLTVDYVERFYASGKISGSKFVKREGKPSEEAVLASRVIDRTLRPLFDNSIRHAVQVIVTVLAVDDNDPVILAINAASLALSVSNIPWAGPVGAVRIGKYGDSTGDEYRINAPASLRGEDAPYLFDLTVCGKDGNINMIEASAHEASEAALERALEEASKEISRLEEFQRGITGEIGKEKKIIEVEKISPASEAIFKSEILPKMEKAIFAGPGKKEIDELHTLWNNLVREKFKEKLDREDFAAEDKLFDDTENDILHEKAIQENQRADGRGMDELRDLYAQAGGVSKILHGAGIFYRGGTHVLSVLTLGGPEDRHMIDSMQTSSEKRFMHHYNFPPYSSGETGRAGFTNRREIGHGALVEKALLMVLPPEKDFPYTIRVVSESMASNGSTSQASICASTLALMDGGVPIKAPVAGIAMGLMLEPQTNADSTQKNADKIQRQSASGQRESVPLRYKILTDIQGPEDHHGDMDFKIAGTREGVTAIQLDVKVEGVPIKILGEAMRQSKSARVAIIERIEKEIPSPRAEISANAPKIIMIKIKPDQIGMVIGSGGKTVKEIKEKTGAEVTIEDDGTVFFSGKGASASEAKKIVEEMTHEFRPGEVLQGEVVKLAEFGAFVSLNPFTDGLVHISELAPFRVERVSDIIKVGMAVPVKVIKIDPERGKISLSIKEADPHFFKNAR